MNKNYLIPLFAILLIFSLAELGVTEEFQIVGPKALGMGGAYVAVVNDSTATYWNPGVYGTFGEGGTNERTFSGNLPLGAGYEMHESNISEALDTLQDVDFAALQNLVETGNIEEADDITDVLTAINVLFSLAEDKIGATALVDGGLYFQYKNYGIGVAALGDANAFPSIDTFNIGVTSEVSIDDLLTAWTPPTIPGLDPGAGNYFFTLNQREDLIEEIEALGGDWDTDPANTNAETYVDTVDKILYVQTLLGEEIVLSPEEAADAAYLVAATAYLATAGGNIANNESSVTLKGIAVIEVPFTYGYAIPQQIFGGDLSVGANIKYMYAQTINREIDIADVSGEEVFDPNTLYDDIETASNFGIDLGVLYQYTFLIRDYKLPSRFGLLGRNLNNPSFNDIEVGPQLRLGLSLLPLEFLTLAFDIDVLKNDTYIDELESQNVSVGIEARPLRWFAIRAGVYDNISETDIGAVFTAGLGLNFKHFHFDLAGAFAPESVTVEGLNLPLFGDNIPKDLRLQLIISALF